MVLNLFPQKWINVIVKKEEIEKLCQEMDIILIKEQKYSIAAIKENDKFLFFWGHQAALDGTITKTCFSQWWFSAFVQNGVTYQTAEHWMMAKKS